MEAAASRDEAGSSCGAAGEGGQHGRASLDTLKAAGLHRLAVGDKFEQLQIVLANATDAHSLANVADYDGRTPLMRAVFHGHAPSAAALLAAGADVRATAPDGTTALFVAAWCGHTACVEALLAAGADCEQAETLGSRRSRRRRRLAASLVCAPCWAVALPRRPGAATERPRS